MTHARLPRLVLGHNQFFGVNHLSSQQGAERAAYFAKVENVLHVVNRAIESGAGGLMLSTHPRAVSICDALRVDPRLRNDLQMFPLLPYAQKYVTKANEVGMVRAVTGVLSDASVRDRLGLGIDFARTIVRRDSIDVVRALIRLELRIFRKLSVPVVFLHDAISDLLLSLGMPKVFEVYCRTLQNRFGARMGVATKNLPLLVDRFSAWGLELPVVLTHVNRVGFHVNPSQDVHEQYLNSPELEIMAMGTLASGYLKPDDAAGYVLQFSAVKSVVIGASSSTHVSEVMAPYLRTSE